MKRNVVLIFTLVLFAACKDKNSTPTGVLSKKKMQEVVWDMMRADQFLADYVLNKDTSLNKTTESLKYYQEIFALHKISKDQFQHSFSYYQSRPDLLKEIMDSINAPEKVAPITPVQVDAPTEIAIPQTDTTINNPVKVLADTSIHKKKIKPAIAD